MTTPRYTELADRIDDQLAYHYLGFRMSGEAAREIAAALRHAVDLERDRDRWKTAHDAAVMQIDELEAQLVEDRRMLDLFAAALHQAAADQTGAET